MGSSCKNWKIYMGKFTINSNKSK